MALLVNGLTEKHKAFLYDYAQQKLGSKSRTQAILSLINEKMSEYETSQKSIETIESDSNKKKDCNFH
jgi:hypothetical protein